MKCLTYILSFSFLVAFTSSCNSYDEYKQLAKSTDSLTGALNQSNKILQEVDTAMVLRALSRFYYNKQFIKQNINDTVNKTEADCLYQFYKGGASLESFKSNRVTLLARTALINDQLTKLSQDIKNKTLETALIANYLDLEKKQVQQIITLSTKELKLFYMALEEYKISLSGVEQLIRARNKGQLPTVIKDTISI